MRLWLPRCLLQSGSLAAFLTPMNVIFLPFLFIKMHRKGNFGMQVAFYVPNYFLNMNISTKLMAAACAGIILFAACKKDKDDDNTVTPAAKTKKDYLVDGKWRFDAYTSVVHMTDSASGLDTTYTENGDLDECDKDDFALFLSTGKMLTDEGAVKCDEEDPQVDSSALWSLNSDFSKLTINQPDIPISEDYDVLELTSTNLKMRTKYKETGNGQTYESEFTVTAKNIK
jgi:hypothetical protein